MQSVLIYGKDNDDIRNETQKICKENSVSEIDIEIIRTEKSVSIKDIRELQKKLFLKPIKSDKKALVLEAFAGMTLESQNAFLKILEEPPQNTIIIILTNSLDFVIPTILSRCTVIPLLKIKKLNDEEISEKNKLMSEIMQNSSLGFLVAQNNSKTKEEALIFLENLIISVHKDLEKYGKKEELIERLQRTYADIKTTNINVRFALENLFLNL